MAREASPLIQSEILFFIRHLVFIIYFFFFFCLVMVQPVDARIVICLQQDKGANSNTPLFLFLPLPSPLLSLPPPTSLSLSYSLFCLIFSGSTTQTKNSVSIFVDISTLNFLSCKFMKYKKFKILIHFHSSFEGHCENIPSKVLNSGSEIGESVGKLTYSQERNNTPC